jgi:hypothetical protein
LHLLAVVEIIIMVIIVMVLLIDLAGHVHEYQIVLMVRGLAITITAMTINNVKING